MNPLAVVIEYHYPKCQSIEIMLVRLQADGGRGVRTNCRTSLLLRTAISLSGTKRPQQESDHLPSDQWLQNMDPSPSLYYVMASCLTFQSLVVSLHTTEFNIHKFYVLPTQHIYVCCMDFRTNSDYFPIRH